MESSELVFKAVTQLRTEVAQEQIGDFVISSIYMYLIKKDRINDADRRGVAENVLKPYGEELIAHFSAFLSSLDDDGLYELIKVVFVNKNLRPFDNSSSAELCDLVLKLFGDLYGGPIVCDACVGRGDFLIRAIEYSIKKRFVFKDLMGVDINAQNVDICNMTLQCLNALSKVGSLATIKVANSMQDDFGYPMTHCYVFPPLGLRFSMGDKNVKSKLYDDIEFSGRNTAEWIFIDNVVSQNLNGRTIAITTPRALFSEDDRTFRNRLIQDGRLEGIIELPTGAVGFTGINLIMLIFSNKNKQVKVLDAKDCVIKQKKPIRTILDAEMVCDLYNASNCSVKTIDEMLSAKNLTPSYVNAKKVVINNGVPLSDIAEVFPGSQYTLRNFEAMFSSDETGYRILTSSDIENGLVDWKKLQAIKYEDTKFDKFAVRYGDIIVTSKSSKVKTAFVDIVPKGKILVTGGMIVVRPNREKLNPVYLKMFLESELGQASLKQIQKGTIIVTINAKDLATIQIPLIDMEKQNRKAERYINQLSTIVSYKKEIERLERKIAGAFDDEEE